MNTPGPPLAQFAHAPLLLLIIAFMMLQPLSTDLYLASLPGLASSFNVPPATVQLTLSLFVIGFGGAQLIIGPLSDRFGRRPVLLCGLVLYVAASIFCALAPSITMLIVARFLQALGCCAAVIIARAIVRDAYAPEHSVRVVASASTWLSLAPIVGPIVGSYLQVAFGWRAAFAALGLFSACVLAVSLKRMPETNLHRNARATELSGLLENYRLVLGSREFWAHALPGALSYGAIFSFISGSSFVLIRVLDVPTSWFGYCFAFGVSGYMSGTIICRRLLPTIGSARTFRIGSLTSLVAGCGFMAAVAAGIAHWSLMLAAMFLTMLAHGINFPIAQSGAVSPFPQQAGTAAGLMGALYMSIAFTVGTVVGATHNGTLYPLAIISCTLGLLIFASVRSIPAALSKAES
ncbi:multidrug effflux MFS transporter [Noviherbaspirillum saxi]|uniref:multidrug effflux MFS transporter n=1 Tax=Noviherbaspirillum saxi TaxID=2320863 RepID=UPI001314972E|nr:multidrug effflux MFS transporter [Noviherbaspirillum saxi]